MPQDAEDEAVHDQEPSGTGRPSDEVLRPRFEARPITKDDFKPFRIGLHNFERSVCGIEQLNAFLEESLADHERKENARITSEVDHLDQEGRLQIERLREVTTRQTPVTLNHPGAVAIMEARVKLMTIGSQSRHFVRTMALVRLVADFEQFLRAHITDAAMIRREILKTSQKKLTFEEVVGAQTWDGVLEIVIEKELFMLFHEDIDKIDEYLYDRMRIRLNHNQDWADFKERFYRRNILVHNDGHVNRIYQQKVGQREGPRYLGVSPDYLTESLRLFGLHARRVHDAFISKFGSTYPPELQNRMWEDHSRAVAADEMRRIESRDAVNLPQTDSTTEAR